MKLILKIFITSFFLITNYELLITNEFSRNEQPTTDNELLTRNSQLLISSSELIAQEDSLSNNETVNDTIIPKPLEDFVSEVPISKRTFEMSKSPTKAVLFSFLLPGLGQFYVESYWKVPIFLGATGVLTYLIIDNHNKYTEEQKKYDAMEPTDFNRSRTKIIKEFYRDQRDQDIFYLAGVYILSAVDAYVGAHLFDFDVSDDLTLKLQTGYFYGPRVGFSLNW